MNDLERDLHELFDQRARDVDPEVLAPEPVLRRGRRRQARTAAVGVIAGVAVLAVAFVAVGNLREPDRSTPASTRPRHCPNARPSSVACPVDAPAGWTLIDDSPLAALLPTSTQSCSFSGSGTAVAANGSPIADSPQPEPSQSCSSEPVSPLPALPVLQLANFEIPLMQTVCGLGDNDPAATLPANGVAVYVVAFPVPSNADGSDTSFAEGCGPGAWTMTQFFSADRTIRYTAIFLQGSEASPEDTTFASDYINSLDGTNVIPTTWDSPRGPGYVLVAGGTEQEGWRLEAGIASFANDGRPMPASIFVTTAPGAEKAKADATLFNSEGVDLVGDQVVQHGNLAEGFTGVDVVDPDGAVTHADVYAWPQDLLRIAGSHAFDGAGGIWVATPPQEGDVTFIPGADSQTDASSAGDTRRQQAAHTHGRQRQPGDLRARSRATTGRSSSTTE